MDTLLSIITMYRYDPTVFDEMTLPEELDKELLTDNLMLELGELELLYNDPNMMKFAIGKWSKKELKKWQELYKTTMFDYNPIHNYDRVEEFIDAETRALTKSNTQTRNLAGTSLETRDLETGIVGVTDTTDNDTQGGANSNKKEVSGYNTETLAIESIETQTLGSTNNKTVHTETEQTGTDSGTVGAETSDTGTVADSGTDSGTVEVKRTGSAKGNIGVTTTQQMIEAERKVLEFNVYDYIIESFKRRFCILVY